MERRHALLVGLAAVVLLAGCATMGGGGQAMGGGDSGATSGDGGAGGADGSGADGGGGTARESAPGTGVAAGDRAIIRTGTVELRVEEFATARSAVVDHVRSRDGYVGGSGSTHHSRDNQSWTTGYVVVRVPSGRFADVLSFVRDRGTVLEEETRTEDVTDRLVDLEARLRNLQQRRDRLRSFYERANSTGELLDVEAELSEVQSEIEQLEAKRRSLERSVAYATLRVELREPAPERAGDRTAGASLVGTLLRSTATFVDGAYGTVLFGARLAPYLVFLGVPALVVARLVGRRYGPLVGRTDGSRDGTAEPAGDTDGRDDTEGG
jgi:hypothetical protein